MKTKKDSQQRIQAIASVLELFRKADALRVDGGVLISDWWVMPVDEIDIKDASVALVTVSYNNGDGEIDDEISLAEIEKMAEARLTKTNDAINKLFYKDQNGESAYVELFRVLPVRAYYEQSVLAKQFAVEAMFCGDLKLADLVSLYDELVAASGSSASLSKTFKKYALDPWQPFEDYSHSSLVEEMTSFARAFDTGVERPRRFY